ncbi:hypothetical protein V2J09_005439 [Rumex salicifolius]
MESARNSVLVDPLSCFSVVSLFPRTFNQLVFDPDPNSRHDDPIETVGAHLDSMALKNPNRLLEQAKRILDGGLESLNVDNLLNVRGGDTNMSLQRDIENLKNASDQGTVGDLLGGNLEKMQSRRPDLGRKKSRFSLQPNSSQSTKGLKSFVDIDKFPDPEEFFSAVEKHENAMNELRRQTGKPLMDLDQNVPHMAEKRRRSGLLRKSASYKHRCSMAPSGDAKTFLSSQETLSQDLCSPTPSDHCLQTEPTGQENAGKERPGDIDEELQSSSDKDDESDEIIGMLQKRFKPVEINKSCLPELTSVLQSEFSTVGESLQDSQDKMSDLHSIVSNIAKDSTLVYNNVERRSGHPSTSPRPPKSPHSSLSLLKAHLFQSRQGKDPFSALDMDLSPVGKAVSCEDTPDLAARDLQKSVKDSMKMQNISTVNSMNTESGHTSGDNDARETNLNSPMHESERNVFNNDTQDFMGAEFISSVNNKGDSMMSDIPSDSILQMELDDDIVEHGDSDVNPRLPLHDKESDATHNMETTEDISKTLGVYSDDELHTDLDHANQRNHSSKLAAHETESNVVHDKNMHDFDAENLSPSEKTMKDYSMDSGIPLNMTLHAELDHDIMAHNTIGRVLEDNPSKVSDDAAISVDEHMELVDGVVEEDVEGHNMKKSNCNMEQSTLNAVEDLGEDRHFSGANDDLDHDRPSSSLVRPLKKTQKASSKIAERNRSKTREPAERRVPAARKHTRECKELSRRKSLAACGTQWEDGLRRSTRIRTRPLEFWKGERQLYGRIHEALVTVVGTKYFSPTKEAGQASLKVKSYVSDEYKEMVEWAALH